MPLIDIPSDLIDRIRQRSACCGVIGLGYVGLPLVVSAARQGFRTAGFDIDPAKPKLLNKGHSYIGAVKSDELKGLVSTGRFCASNDFSSLPECNVVIICVPTPLTRQREPDLSYVVRTSETVAQHLRTGQLIVFESTTYPGTTWEIVKPILETTGLKSELDFPLGFSPEREDPGNAEFSTSRIPKIVSGDGPNASQAVEAFYGAVIDKVVPVSSMDVAEAVKITENVFRAVNIALVNELKMVFDRMGIDIWEVIEAAKTKPFEGQTPVQSGLSGGGNVKSPCISIHRSITNLPCCCFARSRLLGLFLKSETPISEVRIRFSKWVARPATHFISVT